ncbi:MAG: hypothetical protein QM536_09725 [Chitinophagaceae bacterium]|nr:hypothetical protein [Chitinophagaceae bacterium]
MIGFVFGVHSDILSVYDQGGNKQDYNWFYPEDIIRFPIDHYQYNHKKFIDTTHSPCCETNTENIIDMQDIINEELKKIKKRRFIFLVDKTINSQQKLEDIDIGYDFSKRVISYLNNKIKDTLNKIQRTYANNSDFITNSSSPNRYNSVTDVNIPIGTVTVAYTPPNTLYTRFFYDNKKVKGRYVDDISHQYAATFLIYKVMTDSCCRENHIENDIFISYYMGDNVFDTTHIKINRLSNTSLDIQGTLLKVIKKTNDSLFKKFKQAGSRKTSFIEIMKHLQQLVGKQKDSAINNIFIISPFDNEDGTTSSYDKNLVRRGRYSEKKLETEIKTLQKELNTDRDKLTLLEVKLNRPEENKEISKRLIQIMKKYFNHLFYQDMEQVLTYYVNEYSSPLKENAGEGSLKYFTNLLSTHLEGKDIFLYWTNKSIKYNYEGSIIIRKEKEDSNGIIYTWENRINKDDTSFNSYLLFYDTLNYTTQKYHALQGKISLKEPYSIGEGSKKEVRSFINFVTDEDKIYNMTINNPGKLCSIVSGIVFREVLSESSCLLLIYSYGFMLISWILLLFFYIYSVNKHIHSINKNDNVSNIKKENIKSLNILRCSLCILLLLSMFNINIVCVVFQYVRLLAEMGCIGRTVCICIFITYTSVGVIFGCTSFRNKKSAVPKEYICSCHVS